MRKAATAITLAGLVLAGTMGCTSDGDGDGEPSAATPSASETVTLPEELDEEFEALGLNSRGNIPVDEGGSADFKDVSDGTVFAEIVAQSVQTNFRCPAPSAKKSINGQFVAIDFDLDLTDEFADSGFPSMTFSIHDFRAWDAKGVGVVDPVGNAETCIRRKDRVSTPLKPGDQANGLVILDVPKGHGSASYVVGGFQGSYGWEWFW